MRAFAAALAISTAGAVSSHYYPSSSYGSYGTHSHAGYGNVANPWLTGTSSTVSVVDKSKWYSPYQQYSPIRIPFVPAQHAGTKYARCEMTQMTSLDTTKITAVAGIVMGNILLAQRHGKASMSQIFINSATATSTSFNTAATATINFQINEYGRLEGTIKNGASAIGGAITSIGTNGGTTACTLTGTEFNPLRETDKMGRANPYQDKSRGRLTAYVVATASGIGPALVLNKNVLVNLSGSDSVIGRSIVAFIDNGGSTFTGNGEMDTAAELLAEAVNCCIIGYDTPPTLASQSHHHHGPGTVAHTHTGNSYEGHTHSGFSHGGQHIYQSQPSSQGGGLYSNGTGGTVQHAHQGYGAQSSTNHGHGYSTGYGGYPTAYGYGY